MTRADALAALAGGTAGVLVAAVLGRPLLAVLAVAATLALVASAASVDLRTRRIPNPLTYGGALGALALAAGGGLAPLALATAGLAFAAAVMAVVYVIGRGGLGLGDVKLAAAVGAVLGPAGVPAFLLASGIAGGLAALILLALGRSRSEVMPYAPALAVGALVALISSGTVLG
jgi:leader peptidase (prepilin peptidase)/N-methyltransferase